MARRRKRKPIQPSQQRLKTTGSPQPELQDRSRKYSSLASVDSDPKVRTRFASVGAIASIVGVVVAIAAIFVSIRLSSQASDRETANLKHYLLVQPLDLQENGTASKWEVILGTHNSGPAAVRHANTYVAFSPTRARLLAPPMVVDRPPLTRVEVESAGVPREVSFAFEELAPRTGFSVRFEFAVPERLRDKIKFKLGDPELVKNFVQLVGTSGEKIRVDYSSMSAQPIPTL
jgi:hypothetical protein